MSDLAVAKYTVVPTKLEIDVWSFNLAVREDWYSQLFVLRLLFLLLLPRYVLSRIILDRSIPEFFKEGIPGSDTTGHGRGSWSTTADSY